MDAQFWINAWNEGRTGFHQSEYHHQMVKFFPRLNLQEGKSILVPLCGKTKDMLWLKSQKLTVHGVELYEGAVQEFFKENHLSFSKSRTDHFTEYMGENITVSCGDFFKLGKHEAYDFIYDRASLVALPKEMRTTYAQVVIDALKPAGEYLLIVYEYNQNQLSGPPFSISDEEINDLFGNKFSISKMEVEEASKSGKFSELDYFLEKTFVLEKNA